MKAAYYIKDPFPDKNIMKAAGFRIGGKKQLISPEKQILQLLSKNNKLISL